MEIGKRIEKFLQAKNGGNQSELARYLGVTPQAVQKWIAEESTPRGKRLRQIADFFGITEAELAYGEPDQVERLIGLPKSDETSALFLRAAQLIPTTPEIEIESDRRSGPPGRRGIDFVAQNQEGEIVIFEFKGTGGSMGTGLVLRDQPGEIQRWSVTPEWIDKNVKTCTATQNLRIVTGFGDSMRPMFNPGDPLLVDTGVKTVDFDSIYFFRIGDEGFIKRLQRVPGQGLLAISENKSYRDWVITPDMDFEVFARVIKVWCGSDF